MTRTGNMFTAVARGLKALFAEKVGHATEQATPPSISLGHPLKLRQPSNAKLFELLDSQRCKANRTCRRRLT